MLPPLFQDFFFLHIFISLSPSIGAWMKSCSNQTLPEFWVRESRVYWIYHFKPVTKLPEHSLSQFLHLQNENNNNTGFVRIKGLAQNPHIVITQLSLPLFFYVYYSMHSLSLFLWKSTLFQCTASPQTSHSYENDKGKNLMLGNFYFVTICLPWKLQRLSVFSFSRFPRLSSQNFGLSLEHVLFTCLNTRNYFL